MKLCLCIGALLTVLSGYAQRPVPRPFARWFVEDNLPDDTIPYGLRVMAVRLTPQYTILNVRFTNRGKSFLTNKGTYRPVGYIWVSTNARLTAATGHREFAFIKADGIPVYPKSLRVEPLDQVSYSLYFERLDSGIETFGWTDYIDKDNPHHQLHYPGLHVDNPLNPGHTQADSTIAKTAVAVESPKPMQIGDKITFRAVYFAVTKADLLPASFAELDQLAMTMENNLRLTIRIEGHTDAVGDHQKNQQLSQDRAAACRHYLTRKGIAENRIQAVGYGDTRPIRTDDTAEAHSTNRRVDFVILTQ